MTDVYFKDGDVLFDAGAVAIHSDCCCVTYICPEEKDCFAAAIDEVTVVISGFSAAESCQGSAGSAVNCDTCYNDTWVCNRAVGGAPCVGNQCCWFDGKICNGEICYVIILCVDDGADGYWQIRCVRGDKICATFRKAATAVAAPTEGVYAQFSDDGCTGGSATLTHTG